MSRLLRASILLLALASCGGGNFSAPRNLDDACEILRQRPTYYRALKATERKWGVPVHDARELWELLCLEGFQAGLSWITILKKRDSFRAAFDGFDRALVANWEEAQVTAALANPGIIRHRGKIEATIKNARA